MRAHFNHLLIALGAILFSATLLSTIVDLGQALPGQQSVQEFKLARSRLAKMHPGPAAVSQPFQEDGGTAAIASPLPSDGDTLGMTAQDIPLSPPTQAAEAMERDSLLEGDIPTRLVIPAIGLDAPVIPAETLIVKVAGDSYQQWKSPDKPAGGWHESSALLGQPGNTVINGHHNIYGKVFARLVDLQPGDIIIAYGLQQAYVYQVTNKMILPEKHQALDVRMDNARWILPSEDERLTLVTCWPAESNTHRLIIVATPLGSRP